MSLLETELAKKADKTEVYTKTQTNTAITNKVAEIVAGAPEDFDTLKEMSDWISTHEESAAAMNTAIQSKIAVPQTAEIGQILAVKAVDGNGKPTEWETVNPSDDTKITTPQTATVGQLLKVKTVDSNGKPETWETANLSSSEVTTALGYIPINSTTRGAVNGVASLGSDGKVPSGQLPSMGGITVTTLISNRNLSDRSTLVGNISPYKLIIICNNNFSLVIPTSYLISTAANYGTLHNYSLCYANSYSEHFMLYTSMNSNNLSISVTSAYSNRASDVYVYGIS